QRSATPGMPTATPMPDADLRTRAAAYFRDLQERICAALAELDGKAAFREDAWQRPGGGGGRSRVLADGGLFEKAGVNFSEAAGRLRPLQEMVRRLLLPAPQGRAARRRRHLLRLPRRRPRRAVRLRARLRRRPPGRLLADRAPPQGPAVHGARARLPGVPPRPLRRVQPDLRPRDPVRPEDG